LILEDIYSIEYINVIGILNCNSPLYFYKVLERSTCTIEEVGGILAGDDVDESRGKRRWHGKIGWGRFSCE
jgi:hypothetical protein